LTGTTGDSASGGKAASVGEVDRASGRRPAEALRWSSWPMVIGWVRTVPPGQQDRVLSRRRHCSRLVRRLAFPRGRSTVSVARTQSQARVRANDVEQPLAGFHELWATARHPTSAPAGGAVERLGLLWRGRVDDVPVVGRGLLVRGRRGVRQQFAELIDGAAPSRTAHPACGLEARGWAVRARWSSPERFAAASGRGVSAERDRRAVCAHAFPGYSIYSPAAGAPRRSASNGQAWHSDAATGGVTDVAARPRRGGALRCRRLRIARAAASRDPVLHNRAPSSEAAPSTFVGVAEPPTFTGSGPVPAISAQQCSPGQGQARRRGPEPRRHIVITPASRHRRACRRR